MRYKAISDEVEKKTRITFGISLTLAFTFIAAVLVYFNWYSSLSNPSISLLIWIIPLLIIMYINGFVMAISLGLKSIHKRIGDRRFVTLKEDSLILEDIVDNRRFEKTFKWDDIKRIVISYTMPADKFRKNKNYIVAIIIDETNYANFRNVPVNIKNRLEYVDSFFYLRYNPDMIEDIEKHWQSEVERHEQYFK